MTYTFTTSRKAIAWIIFAVVEIAIAFALIQYSTYQSGFYHTAPSIQTGDWDDSSSNDINN